MLSLASTVIAAVLERMSRPITPAAIAAVLERMSRPITPAAIAALVARVECTRLNKLVRVAVVVWLKRARLGHRVSVTWLILAVLAAIVPATVAA
jgi:hypothetical protein